MGPLTFEEELQKWETEFKRGFSKPLILLILAEQPKDQNYPYQVTKTIFERTKSKIAIAGSNIYPVLKKMEDDGLITGEKDEISGKRYYSLTDRGKEFVVLLKRSMKDFNDIIREMIDTNGEL